MQLSDFQSYSPAKDLSGGSDSGIYNYVFCKRLGEEKKTVVDSVKSLRLSHLPHSLFFDEQMMATENFKKLIASGELKIKPLYENVLPADHIYNVIVNLTLRHSIFNDRNPLAFLQEASNQFGLNMNREAIKESTGVMAFGNYDEVKRSDLQNIETAYLHGNTFKKISSF